ncbi:hypothetical protein [uncultured Aquimarina sp.]|uniref:hypothetical protein n=1 Tax=uncultured Aquimarina sp. TaxID=575652 RepID=UPI00260C8EAF|nr:hypothetical protein [uncultured Aquimarina sp.]
MDFDIVTSNNTPEKFFSLISKYWSINDNKLFIHSEKDLREEYGRKFKEIVARFSSTLIKVNCALCHSSFNILAKSRDVLIENLNTDNKICELCELYSPNYLGYYENKELDVKSQYDEISEFEKFILKGLVSLKSKMLIYRHIFNNNLEDKDLWKLINGLEKKGLIFIERTNDCKIKSFQFPTEIIKLIKDNNF